ncbi:MAG: PKD domain-containing protein [Flavobacteriales bacterium]|nr:PKD domain-containing protein [Flavobacteriales bacterium]
MELEAGITDASCPGTPDGQVELEITGGTAPYSVNWNDGSTNPILTASAGSYSVTVTDANNCVLTSEDFFIGEGAGPTAVASANATTVLVGEVVTFINNSTGGDAYNWDFGDGATSGEESPTHAYDLPGSYTVTLTVSNGSCTSSSTVTITVELSTGLAEATPTTPMSAWMQGDHLVVEHGFTDGLPVQLEVINEAGQVWKQLRVAGQAGRMTIPAGDLASGIWYVRVSNSGASRTMPVVVVR